MSQTPKTKSVPVPTPEWIILLITAHPCRSPLILHQYILNLLTNDTSCIVTIFNSIVHRRVHINTAIFTRCLTSLPFISSIQFASRVLRQKQKAPWEEKWTKSQDFFVNVKQTPPHRKLHHINNIFSLLNNVAAYTFVISIRFCSH